MLNEQEIVGLLDNSLSPDERVRLTKTLEGDPDARRQLREQSQMDNALRVALGGAAGDERVKQSVLAIVRGESEAALKQHVLADTTFLLRSSRREEVQPSDLSAVGWLFRLLRRRAWATGLATACVGLLVGWLFMFPRGTKQDPRLVAAIETPARVDFPAGTQIFPRPNTKIQHDGSAGSFTPQSGDGLRVSAGGSSTVTFADGTVLHLEPGTEVRFESVSTSPRNGGKQLRLVSGSLSADVAKQPDGLPLLIETPHALVTVVGTEFDLNVATNQTELEVTRGLVKLAETGVAQPVSVAAGEFAVAAPHAAMRYGRLARNPFLWPFSSTSIWNRSLGSAAKYSPLPDKFFVSDGPLQDAVRPRTPFLGSAGDPLRRIWVNGETLADIRLPDRNLPRAGMRDAVVLLQRARRFALELHNVTVRPDGDLDATDIERFALNGPGTMSNAIPAIPFGLSHLGGLLRTGELESGIRHALAARVSSDRLAGRDFARPLTVWPAAGNAATGADKETLCVGALLAIPPNVDLRAIVGDSGPAYELARAMQNYGVYVTGAGDAPFVLLADSARIPEVDAWLTKLVPLLQVVANNSSDTPAGGGAPRRDSAPALPGETP